MFAWHIMIYFSENSWHKSVWCASGQSDVWEWQSSCIPWEFNNVNRTARSLHGRDLQKSWLSQQDQKAQRCYRFRTDRWVERFFLLDWALDILHTHKFISSILWYEEERPVCCEWDWTLNSKKLFFSCQFQI